MPTKRTTLAKLSAYNKQFFLHQITFGKFNNAIQATNFINSTCFQPVYFQTVKNGLKEAGFYFATKKKVLMLKVIHCQRQLILCKLNYKGLKKGVMVR